jgi:HEPN domain-containing protein
MADADASRYWRIAQADLLEARRMRELRGFRSSSIGFLLQQAAEKALKAWIQAAGGAAPFTHDLGALLDLLQEMGEAPADYEVLTELNFFAVQLRYDDQLVMEEPDWPLCFALLERLLLQIEGRCSGP